jgi:hypothetical protein
MEKVLVACRKNPFIPGHADVELAEGGTIAEILDQVGLMKTAEIHSGIFVFIDDRLIERDAWQTTKPTNGSTVSIGIAPGGGGGGGGGKNAMRTVAMIAVMVIAIAASYGAATVLAPGMGFAAGGLGASIIGGIAGAAVGIAGAMLVNALIPPPTPKNSSDSGPNYLSRMGNRMDPYGPVPKIYGKHRVFPRYASMPYTELVGSKENYLHCLFLIGKGKYDLSDFKIGDTALSSYQGVEMAIYNTDYTLDFPLFPNDVGEESLSILLEQNVQHVRTTTTDVEHISLEFTFPEGLYRISSSGGRRATTVEFTIEYSPKNQNNWKAMGGTRINVANNPTTLLAVGQTATSATGSGTIAKIHYSVIQQFVETIEIIESYGIGWCPESGGCYNVIRYEDVYQDVTVVSAIDVSVTSGSFSASQTVQVEYSPGNYVNLTSTSVYLNPSTVHDENGAPFRWGTSFDVPKGQYDIRVTRTSSHSESNHYYSTYWTVLRGVTKQVPVTLTGCTLVALRIKASNQLNGVLDQFNCMAEGFVEVWDGANWTLAKSRSPVWAFVDILCGTSNKRPISKSRIDLDAAIGWHHYCVEEGFNFDAIIDYKTTVWELLRQVCAVGRGSPGMTDNKFTIIGDMPKPMPVQHFSPRNSWGFSGSRVFPDIPHALRVRFPNEVKQYEEDECIIYDDGYNSGNATIYETIEFFGVTNYNHCWKLGRYHLATLRLRPETYQFNTDVEHMVCTRGDRVRLTHDVLLVGLGQGRIKSISTTSISIDDEVVMVTGKTYGFQFRRSDGTFKTCTLTTVNGTHPAGTALTISPAMNPADLPAVGDLAFWGESEHEAIEVVVSRIEPGPDLTAKLTCIPYNEAIYTADQGTIPIWDSNITLPPVVDRRPPKPKIVSSIYNYRPEQLNPDGTVALIMSVGFSMNATGFLISGYPETSAGFIAQYREDDAQWTELPHLSREQRKFEFPVKNGLVYDMRIRSFNYPNGLSDWDTLENVTVDFAAQPPSMIANLRCVGGGTSFTTTDLEVTWDTVINEYGGASILDYKVEVRSSDGNTLRRTEFVTQNYYMYDFDKNVTDGGPTPALQIRVWARNKFDVLSDTFASAVFTNPAPQNPSGLTSYSPMGGVEFGWNANTEADFSHFIYRFKIGDDPEEPWSGWKLAPATAFFKMFSEDEKALYGETPEFYFEIKAVDVFFQESGATASNQTAGSLNIDLTDIDDFAINASKIFMKIPVIQNLTLTDNSPSAGRISWSDCEIYYNGNKYEINAGSTPENPESPALPYRYIYWKDLATGTSFATGFLVSQEHPADIESDWKSGEDFIIAVNVNGVAQEAWNAIANQVIGSAYIMNAAIEDAHIKELNGSKIIASSSIAIGSRTFGAGGMQIEYDGDHGAQFHIGNGLTGDDARYMKYIGGDVLLKGTFILEEGSMGFVHLSDAPKFFNQGIMPTSTPGDQTINFALLGPTHDGYGYDPQGGPIFEHPTSGTFSTYFTKNGSADFRTYTYFTSGSNYLVWNNEPSFNCGMDSSSDYGAATCVPVITRSGPVNIDFTYPYNNYADEDAITNPLDSSYGKTCVALTKSSPSYNGTNPPEYGVGSNSGLYLVLGLNSSDLGGNASGKLRVIQRVNGTNTTVASVNHTYTNRRIYTGSSNPWRYIWTNSVDNPTYASSTTENSIIRFQDGAKKIIKLRMWRQGSNQVPSAVEIQGSNTGSFTGEQTTIYTNSSLGTWSYPAWKDLTFENLNSYEYYKIILTFPSVNWTSMTSMQIMDASNINLGTPKFSRFSWSIDFDDHTFSVYEDGATVISNQSFSSSIDSYLTSNVQFSFYNFQTYKGMKCFQNVKIWANEFNPDPNSITIGKISSNAARAWLRFENVNIPKNATINSAKLVFNSKSQLSGTVNVRIQIENAENPLVPVYYSDLVGRSLGTASDKSITSQWNAEQSYEITGLEAIFEEHFGRSYWQEGNTIQIHILDNGSSSSVNRMIYSYEANINKKAYLVINVDTQEYTLRAKDLWRNTNNGTLYIYSGTEWLPVTNSVELGDIAFNNIVKKYHLEYGNVGGRVLESVTGTFVPGFVYMGNKTAATAVTTSATAVATADALTASGADDEFFLVVADGVGTAGSDNSGTLTWANTSIKLEAKEGAGSWTQIGDTYTIKDCGYGKSLSISHLYTPTAAGATQFRATIEGASGLLQTVNIQVVHHKG